MEDRTGVDWQLTCNQQVLKYEIKL